MRAILSFFLLSFFSLNSLALKAINVGIDVIQFSLEEQPYIDVVLRVDGNTCTFIQDKRDVWRSSVMVQIILEQNGEVKAFEKYNLKAQSKEGIVDMLDLRRFFIPSGNYDLSIEITDNKKNENIFKYKSKLDVGQVVDLKMSQALVLKSVKKSKKKSSLVRSGLYMEPLPGLLIDDHCDQITVYQEIYKDLLPNQNLVYKIMLQKDTDELISTSEPVIIYKRISGDTEVIPMLVPVDVKRLSSGKYTLTTSIITSKKQEIYTEKLSLMVNHSLMDVLSIEDYTPFIKESFVAQMDSTSVSRSLRAIVAIAPSIKRKTLNYIIKKGSREAQQYALLQFWQDKHKDLAKEGHDSFMNVVESIDKQFYSTVGDGFETDRGYIYLRYGKPNKVITVTDEPTAPPYEIWYYNHLEETLQTDVRFLFYDAFQANNFELLHSTCYGERSNPAWETILYKFNKDEQIGHTLIATEMEENWGRRAKKLFNDL